MASTSCTTSTTTRTTAAVVAADVDVDSSHHHHHLSEYEILRAKNIEKNNARLHALGLITRHEQRLSNAAAWKRHRMQGDDDEGSKEEDSSYRILEAEASKKKKKTSRKRTTKQTPPPDNNTLSSVTASTNTPSRKSRRLQGRTPAFLTTKDGIIIHEAVDNNRQQFGDATNKSSSPYDDTSTLQQQQHDREAHVEELRLARRAAALRFYGENSTDEAAERAGRENPTATYQHCAMRVQTMTHKALRNRIKAIERATGKHCVVKMAIFKSCLQDEGLWELADLAGQALERLKALQPPPEE